MAKSEFTTACCCHPGASWHQLITHGNPSLVSVPKSLGLLWGKHPKYEGGLWAEQAYWSRVAESPALQLGLGLYGAKASTIISLACRQKLYFCGSSSTFGRDM